MLPRWAVQKTVRTLDWFSSKFLPAEEIPAHQRTGRRGEEAAYFHLRSLGYTLVARNFRSPHHRGEIDLIGWQENVLCFIEVKTRTSRNVKPAEAAVDQHKIREMTGAARQYLRHMPPSCPWRFDILSVYYENRNEAPRFELFRDVLSPS